MSILTEVKATIRIALVENDPLRLIGFRALLESQADLDLISPSLAEIVQRHDIGLVLLADRHRGYGLEMLSSLKLSCPHIPIIVIGSRADDESMLAAIISGAKGYVFEGAPPSEFVEAIHVVSQGSIWVPRRVMSMFVELTFTRSKRMLAGSNRHITDREKEVLKMLVAGLSNREIGEPLGIVERTVKAHISKMMRKVGVQNRIALSVHAITHSLVSPPPH